MNKEKDKRLFINKKTSEVYTIKKWDAKSRILIMNVDDLDLELVVKKGIDLEEALRDAFYVLNPAEIEYSHRKIA